MPRFYITPPLTGLITLEAEDAHHIRDVLRLSPGEAVTLCDGQGLQAQAELTQVNKAGVYAQAGEAVPMGTDPNIRLCAYPSLSKGERFTWMLQKLVELGISDIYPVLSERCISREMAGSKLDRFRRIVLEAAKQCGRSVLPTLHELQSFASVVKAPVLAGEAKLFCYEAATGSLRRALQASPLTTAHILTGPEGGYSEAEACLAADNGWAEVSLGRIILRCETAPLAAVSAVLYEAGAM